MVKGSRACFSVKRRLCARSLASGGSWQDREGLREKLKKFCSGPADPAPDLGQHCFSAFPSGPPTLTPSPSTWAQAAQRSDRQLPPPWHHSKENTKLSSHFAVFTAGLLSLELIQHRKQKCSHTEGSGVKVLRQGPSSKSPNSRERVCLCLPGESPYNCL